MSIATEIQRLRTAKADIKTAIEEKGVEVGNGLIDTYADKISEISVGGGDVIDLARYLKAAQFTSLNIFGKSDVELNFDNLTTLNGLFSIKTEEYQNKIVEHLTINCPNLVATLNTFLTNDPKVVDTKLKRVTLNVDTQKATSFNSAFAYSQALEVIDGEYPLNASSCTVGLNNFVRQCYALSDFRMAENSIKIAFDVSPCANLSNDTIQSIIDGLADLTGGTTQTVTFHSTVGAKLTEEQKATITAKNWILAY